MIAPHRLPLARSLLLILVPGWAVAAEEAGASKSGDGEPVKISWGIPAKRPILCTRTFTMKSEMGPPGGPKAKLDVKSECQFIDEHEDTKQESETGTRLFVKASETMNSDVIDSCLAGMLLKYRRDPDGDRVEIVNKRSFTQKLLNDALRQFITLGLYIEFPKSARIGESFETDLVHIAPLLASGEVNITSARANLTFESVDPSGAAVFRGRATVVEKGKLEGKDVSATYDGDCIIRTLPAEKRFLSLGFSGKVSLGMQQGALALEGQGDFKLDLATEVGEAVEKARKLKPTIRDRVFRVPEAQVAMKLPSFYADLPEEKGTFEYLRTRDSADGNAYVVIALLKNIPTPPKLYFDQLEAGFKQKPDSGFVSSQKVKSPLGEGRAYLLQVLAEGKIQKIRSEFYSIGKSRYVVFKLVGPSKAFAEALPEYEKARKTLKVGS